MNQFIVKLPTMYKAVAAFIALLVPFLTALGVALSDGTVTTEEWVTIIAAGLALVAGPKVVYETRNRDVSEL